GVRTGPNEGASRLGRAVMGYPVACSVGGREYIAVTTGAQGGGSPRQVPRTIAPDLRPAQSGNAIYVFALPERAGRSGSGGSGGGGSGGAGGSGGKNNAFSVF